MTTKKKKYIYKKALNTWGADMQLNMMIEEMAELTKEIVKYFRGADNSKAILEEMADVTNMLEQLKFMFCRYPETKKIYEDFVEAKLKRLDERLNGE